MACDNVIELLFQSHIDSIKAEPTVVTDEKQELFQSHIDSIKAAFQALNAAAFTCFNPTLIRLRLLNNCFITN